MKYFIVLDESGNWYEAIETNGLSEVAVEVIEECFKEKGAEKPYTVNVLDEPVERWA